MFERVLVPLDGSRVSERVLPLAVTIARKAGGALALVRVVRVLDDLASRIAPTSPYAHYTYRYDEGDSTEQAKNYLLHVAHTLVPSGVQAQKFVLTGEPASSILTYAQEQQIDLIVMSTHGRTGFKKWMLGSITQKLARHSPVPVLIVGRDCDPSVGRWCEAGAMVRVLVGLDGSSWAEAPLRPAGYLASFLSSPMQGELHLLRVVQTLTPDESALYRRAGIVHDFEGEATAVATTYLIDLEARLHDLFAPQCDLNITWSVVEGNNVASTLLCLAQTGKGTQPERPFDLLALATHGRGGFERWVLGSVAERSLATARLPVLIVRPPYREITA